MPRSFLELEFRNPTHPRLGIECFRLSELRRRMPPGFFARTQRPRFHLVALHVAGAGAQEIDFEPFACRPGTLLYVHPGQVLRYLDVATAEAILVLFRPEFVGTEAGDGPVHHLDLADEAYERLHATFALIEREYAATDAGAASEAILRHLLLALLLQVDRAAASAPLPAEVGPRETFARFRRELERSFRRTRRVQDYADRLGCSTKTLNRAALAVAGMPAKRVVDRRVALEAKRLLAHTGMGVGAIGEALGFSEPTNFGKFFRREAGMLPGAFRLAYRRS